MQFLCAAIGAVENTTAPETAKLCDQYIGPALKQLNFNNLPFPVNPYLSPAPHNLIYTDPSLAPGGAGPRPPPEPLPAVSAYTGLDGDVGAPPGWNQPPPPPGLYAPSPSYPSPALYPGAPPPSPPSVENLLLPEPCAAPSGPPAQEPTSQGTPPS